MIIPVVGGRVGRAVRLSLQFDLRWIMISEVRFASGQSAHSVVSLVRPAAARHGGFYVLLLFLIFNDFCQTSYLKIYQTDLRQICRVCIE